VPLLPQLQVAHDSHSAARPDQPAALSQPPPIQPQGHTGRASYARRREGGRERGRLSPASLPPAAACWRCLLLLLLLPAAVANGSAALYVPQAIPTLVQQLMTRSRS
jgi:hypothetical protein